MKTLTSKREKLDSFSKAVSDKNSGMDEGGLKKKLLSLMYVANGDETEKKERDKLNTPIHFSSPEKMERDQTKKENVNKLMEMYTTYGKQELSEDVDKKKTKLTATASRPTEKHGLKGNMKYINENNEKKQRRINDTNLFLAGGKKEAAASIEYDSNMQWTDNLVEKLNGKGRSEMLDSICSYANDDKEKVKLDILIDQLSDINNELIEKQAQNINGQEVQVLKDKKEELDKKINDIKELIRKKEALKRVMLQKFKYHMRFSAMKRNEGKVDWDIFSNSITDTENDSLIDIEHIDSYAEDEGFQDL